MNKLGKSFVGFFRTAYNGIRYGLLYIGKALSNIPSVFRKNNQSANISIEDAGLNADAANVHAGEGNALLQQLQASQASQAPDVIDMSTINAPTLFIEEKVSVMTKFLNEIAEGKTIDKPEDWVQLDMALEDDRTFSHRFNLAGLKVAKKSIKEFVPQHISKGIDNAIKRELQHLAGIGKYPQDRQSVGKMRYDLLFGKGSAPENALDLYASLLEATTIDPKTNQPMKRGVSTQPASYFNEAILAELSPPTQYLRGIDQQSLNKFIKQVFLVLSSGPGNNAPQVDQLTEIIKQVIAENDQDLSLETQEIKEAVTQYFKSQPTRDVSNYSERQLQADSNMLSLLKDSVDEEVAIIEMSRIARKAERHDIGNFPTKLGMVMAHLPGKNRPVESSTGIPGLVVSGQHVAEVNGKSTLMEFFRDPKNTSYGQLTGIGKEATFTVGEGAPDIFSFDVDKTLFSSHLWHRKIKPGIGVCLGILPNEVSLFSKNFTEPTRVAEQAKQDILGRFRDLTDGQKFIMSAFCDLDYPGITQEQRLQVISLISKDESGKLTEQCKKNLENLKSKEGEDDVRNFLGSEENKANVKGLIKEIVGDKGRQKELVTMIEAIKESGRTVALASHGTAPQAILAVLEALKPGLSKGVICTTETVKMVAGNLDKELVHKDYAMFSIASIVNERRDPSKTSTGPLKVRHFDDNPYVAANANFSGKNGLTAAIETDVKRVEESRKLQRECRKGDTNAIKEVIANEKGATGDELKAALMGMLKLDRNAFLTTKLSGELTANEIFEIFARKCATAHGGMLPVDIKTTPGGRHELLEKVKGDLKKSSTKLRQIRTIYSSIDSIKANVDIDDVATSQDNLDDVIIMVEGLIKKDQKLTDYFTKDIAIVDRCIKLRGAIVELMNARKGGNKPSREMLDRIESVSRIATIESDYTINLLKRTLREMIAKESNSKVALVFPPGASARELVYIQQADTLYKKIQLKLGVEGADVGALKDEMKQGFKEILRQVSVDGVSDKKVREIAQKTLDMCNTRLQDERMVKLDIKGLGAHCAFSDLGAYFLTSYMTNELTQGKPNQVKIGKLEGYLESLLGEKVSLDDLSHFKFKQDAAQLLGLAIRKNLAGVGFHCEYLMDVDCYNEPISPDVLQLGLQESSLVKSELDMEDMEDMKITLGEDGSVITLSPEDQHYTIELPESKADKMGNRHENGMLVANPNIRNAYESLPKNEAGTAKLFDSKGNLQEGFKAAFKVEVDNARQAKNQALQGPNAP